MSVYNTTIYFIYFKIVYRQGDMFRPSLGHPQALKKNGSKTTYEGWNFNSGNYLFTTDTK